MAESGIGMDEVYKLNSPPKSQTVNAGDVICSSEPWVWSFSYKFHKILCAYCFRESDSLRTCSRCRLYRYCNSECQTASWEQEHKAECGIMKKIHVELGKLRGYNFNHDCTLEHWTESGCATAQIVMAKVVRKLIAESVTKDDLSRPVGKLAVMEVLEMLPLAPESQHPQPPDAREIDQPVDVDLKLCELIWPDVKTAIPNFDQLMKKVKYNAFPIYEQRGKSYSYGLGIFPRAPYRDMTAVCWDMNVTMDFQGRTLVVRATEDIPAFGGMRSLRHAEMWPTFVEIFQWRRCTFGNIFGHACTCRKCTPEYEAEITPLKCATSGCAERIPSDRRAEQPCPQCGADNGYRLKKLQKFIDVYKANAEDKPGSDMMHNLKTLKRIMNNIDELDKADIVHPDAYFRFICGFSVAIMHLDYGTYEKAWKLLSDGGMINCLRALYPEYHINPARHLVKAGALPYLWAQRIGEKERRRLKSVFDKALPQALEWLKEAQSIYEKLGGLNSQWTQEVAKFIAKYCSGPGKGAGEAVDSAGKSFWPWEFDDAIFKW